MTQPTDKTGLPALVHHPSAVLDGLCTYDAENADWLQFDRHLTAELARLEAENQRYFTPQALRQSLGR
jgi:hypothetical protein